MNWLYNNQGYLEQHLRICTRSGYITVEQKALNILEERTRQSQHDNPYIGISAHGKPSTRHSSHPADAPSKITMIEQSGEKDNTSSFGD
jgi:hypothetical protein